MVLNLESGIDRTVRVPHDEFQEGFKPTPNGGRAPSYCGPDHSSHTGALALVKRLEAYWAARGEVRKYEIVRAGIDRPQEGDVVWGIRTVSPKKKAATSTDKGKRYPSARIREFVLHVLKLYYPDVSIEEVLGSSHKPRIVSARKYCIRRAHEAGIAPSINQLARAFNRNHATVIYTLRGRRTKPAKAAPERLAA